MAEPRGAGRSGGLLFVAVVLFVAYLVLRLVAGLVRLTLTVVVVAVVAGLLVNVLRRR